MADIDSTPTATPPLGPGQIEIWKKIVDVQQHFNDLELRVRNFALIVTGAFLGLGGYAIKDAGIVRLFGLEVSIAGLVVVSAIFPLAAFYFMDRLWYHRLLDGSVYAGISAEKALADMGYNVDLGSKIKEHSPFRLWFTKKKVHSKTKMDLFYAILAGSLLLVAGFLGFGIHQQPMAVKSAAAPVAQEGGSVEAARYIPPALPSIPVTTPANSAGAVGIKGSTSRPNTSSR